MTPENFSPSTLEAIKACATSDYPNECAGFILRSPDGSETVFPCENSHSDPRNYVRVSPEQQFAAERAGEPLAFYHSHPDAQPFLTDADKASCEAMMLPWLVYAHPLNDWDYYTPNGWRAPLLGRKFVHGVHDCYACVRDAYKEYHNLDLPDFERTNLWWERGENLYLENFEKAGFVRVSDLKVGDGILMSLRSPVPNHAAYYMGQNIILHHVYNRLSMRAPYGGFWLKNTYCYVRHKSLF